MDLIVEKLRELRESVNLQKRFVYKFNIDLNVFSESEKRDLESEESLYQRNINLKELIKIKSQGKYNNNKLNYWIINDWGGIKSFKENEKNTIKIEKFSKEIEKGKLTKSSFGTISSLSKISSFIDPDNFVIYDSRVIYVLNWLILSSKSTNLKFFPVPIGRNKIIVDFDINTIIHLTHIDEYKNKKDLYYSDSEAYFVFCSLIKDISKKVFNNKDNIKPYILEMLLFTCVDEIFNELTRKIELKINN